MVFTWKDWLLLLLVVGIAIAIGAAFWYVKDAKQKQEELVYSSGIKIYHWDNDKVDCYIIGNSEQTQGFGISCINKH